METKKITNHQQYIAGAPKEIQSKLKQLSATIKAAAPKSEEVISYNMPGFKQNGTVLVWYAHGKNHIGFYPTPGPIVALKKELEGYKTSKGAIQFPNENPVPLALVKKIVKLRIKETAEKIKLVKPKKQKA